MPAGFRPRPPSRPPAIGYSTALPRLRGWVARQQLYETVATYHSDVHSVAAHRIFDDGSWKSASRLSLNQDLADVAGFRSQADRVIVLGVSTLPRQLNTSSSALFDQVFDLIDHLCAPVRPTLVSLVEASTAAIGQLTGSQSD